MKFLIRLPFAIFLMSTTALLVMLGTWIESKSGSHGQAAKVIYSHPLFLLLLGGFFVNILGSALSRYPYKKRHIPFLITHLGLLMILSGVMIKSLFGVQGNLFLIEGTASNELTLPDTYALKIYTKDKKSSVPIQKSFFGTYLFQEEVPFQLLKISSHGEEFLHSWIDEKYIQLKDLPKISLANLPTSLKLKSGHTFDLFAKQSATFEEDLHQISKQQIAKPFLFIHRSPERKVTVLLSDAQGITSSQVFDFQSIKSYNAYDEGFQGYTLQADLPFWNLQIEKKIISELEEAKNHDSLAPPLKFLAQYCEKTGMNFAEITAEFLKNWAQDKGWLFERFQEPLNWQTLPQDQAKAYFWMAVLFQEDLLAHLEKIRWPLLKALQNLPREQMYLNWMAQIYEIRDKLPTLPDELDQVTSSKMLAAFFRFYQIHWNFIPREKLPPETIITLESPLSYEIRELEPPLKLEQATPVLWLKKKTQVIPLCYDRQGHQLKTPLGDGKACLKFQQGSKILPFTVRLHRASCVKFPGSDQTYSYECDLSLIGPKKTESVELKMNQVYETDEGYRLYLAGMGTLDKYGSKSVQLVINKDPAKYGLTYPGGALVALGSILLFWRRK